MSYDVILYYVLNISISCSESYRMCTERATIWNRTFPEEFLHCVRHRYSGDWLNRRGHPLSKGNKIRLYTLKVLEAKHLSCSPKSSHHFIADHKDPVMITECTHTLHVFCRRY